MRGVNSEGRYADSSGRPDLVRPYFRTGGRTRPSQDLAVESLVSTSDPHFRRLPHILPEHRKICELCLDTRSVAEISAHLNLPLGVVRILIADAIELALVQVHINPTDGDYPSIALLERILDGLRRL